MVTKIILIVLAIAFFIIGVDQSFAYGIAGSYWAFSLSGIFFIFYIYKKHKADLAQTMDEAEAATKPQKPARGTTKGRKKRR